MKRKELNLKKNIKNKMKEQKCKNDKCNNFLNEKQIKRKFKFCCLKCSGNYNGRKNYEKLRTWYKKHPGFNNMKREEIIKKSIAERLKTKNIWAPKISKALKGNKNSSGAIRSSKTIKLLSLQKIGNKNSLGHKCSEEQRTQISESNKRTAEKLIKEGNHTLQKLKRITYSEEKFAKMHPKFLRQFPIKRFLADFYDNETNTIIEIDGSMHLRPERIIFDKSRDNIIKSFGFGVIRIPAKDVLKNSFINPYSYKEAN